MVKIEGSLDELRALLGDGISKLDTAIQATEIVEDVASKAVKKTRRKLSKWQRYIKNRANHIKFKRGPKKGRLDLAAMSKAFKRGQKK